MLNEKITYKYCIGSKYNWEVTSGLFIIAKSLYKKACSCSADINIWDEIIAIENHAIERMRKRMIVFLLTITIKLTWMPYSIY